MKSNAAHKKSTYRDHFEHASADIRRDAFNLLAILATRDSNTAHQLMSKTIMRKRAQERHRRQVKLHRISTQESQDVSNQRNTVERSPSSSTSALCVVLSKCCSCSSPSVRWRLDRSAPKFDPACACLTHATVQAGSVDKQTIQRTEQLRRQRRQSKNESIEVKLSPCGKGSQ